ncbi:MAG: fibronectin type III domain-containing protein [Bacteroidetes bacterium]|nr:fibronectin type III domain-containing protein [Bacteroidota bacterium]
MKTNLIALTICLGSMLTTTAGNKNLSESAPTRAAANLAFNAADADRLSIHWQNGNGARRIVIASKNHVVSAEPINGKDYNASNEFGKGEKLSGAQYVVYDGTADELSISNLDPNTLYYFAVYEYNGEGSNTVYLNQPLYGSWATLVAPSFPVINAAVASVTDRSVTLRWDNDLIKGSGRIILARKGKEVNAKPVDKETYAANSLFPAGSSLKRNNYVVYKGDGNEVTITNLEPGVTYFFAIFEYNGKEALVFNKENPVRLAATTFTK